MQNIQYAGIGKRLLSFTIDDIIVSILFIAIFFEQIAALKTPETMMMFIVQYSWVLYALKVIYHTFFIAYNGATIGKYAVKIKAIDEISGTNLTWSQAFIRAVVREIGEMLFYFTFFYAFFNAKRQTLHDKISSCVVVNV